MSETDGSCNYVLIIEPHLSDWCADTLFMFQSPPSDQELKSKIGKYFIQNANRMLKDYIAEHFMSDEWSEKKFMEKFSEQYYVVLDRLGIPHKFYKSPDSYRISGIKNKDEEASESDEENYHSLLKILNLLVKDLSKNPSDVYDLFMISWVGGSDYGYAPLILPITNSYNIQ